MASLRYPTGIQTFSELIEEGYVYIDKTRYIDLLLRQNKYVFLSRPRRFGKSLLTTTLKAFFEGRRGLFKGLYIDRDDIDWTPSPVLHFDFNTGLYTEEDGLRKRINQTLLEYERIFGITDMGASVDALPLRFETLIKTVYGTTGRKVVILVDEYDKPLLGLSEDEPLFEKNQRILKSFYSNLKSMDEYIRFGFLTGVARFSKVSIFSDLNNLDDISLDNRYSDICGLSEKDVIENLHSGIEELAHKRDEDYDTTLSVLRGYYDGYLFATEGSRLYNPYSLLQCLNSQSVQAYWFESGTPTFLVKSIRDNRVDPMEINDNKYSRRDLLQVSLTSRDPIPLMYQTGYVTIDKYDAIRDSYTLRFPNIEVEKAFAEDLLPLYVKDIKATNSPFNYFKFQDDLYDGDPKNFMKRLATLFKAMPVEDQCESVYRAVTFLLCKIMSIDTRAEQHSYRGHSDLEVLMPNYVYLFEFKYNKSVREAMEQIHSRDYAGKYALDSRPVYLIGANYDNSKEKRGLYYDIVEFRK